MNPSREQKVWKLCKSFLPKTEVITALIANKIFTCVKLGSLRPLGTPKGGSYGRIKAHGPLVFCIWPRPLLTCVTLTEYWLYWIWLVILKIIQHTRRTLLFLVTYSHNFVFPESHCTCSLGCNIIHCIFQVMLRLIILNNLDCWLMGGRDSTQINVIHCTRYRRFLVITKF